MTTIYPSRLPGDWELIRHAPRSDYGADAYTLWPYGAILLGLPEDAARAINALPRLLAALEACIPALAYWKSGYTSPFESDVECLRAIPDILTRAHSAIEDASPAGNPLPPPPASDPAKKPYSVLLLYPDHVNDDGAETYYDFVEATDPIAAVAEARRHALATNEWTEEDVDPDDFVPLLVTEGHHYGQPTTND